MRTFIKEEYLWCKSKVRFRIWISETCAIVRPRKVVNYNHLIKHILAFHVRQIIYSVMSIINLKIIYRIIHSQHMVYCVKHFNSKLMELQLKGRRRVLIFTLDIKRL